MARVSMMKQLVEGYVKAMLGGMGGMGGADALKQSVGGYVRGQVSGAIAEATGLPSGLISSLLGGAKPHEALQSYVESEMYAGLAEATGVPVELLQHMVSQREASRARHRAARVQPEDIALTVVSGGASGVLTYAMRNRQYSAAADTFMSVIDVAVPIAAGAATAISAGALAPVAAAAVTGYQAAQTAYMGNLNGLNTAESLASGAAGAAGAAISTYTQSVGVTVNTSWTPDGGFGAGIGLGFDLGSGMSLGATVNIQEGQGVTGGQVGLKYGKGDIKGNLGDLFISPGPKKRSKESPAAVISIREINAAD